MGFMRVYFCTIYSKMDSVDIARNIFFLRTYLYYNIISEFITVQYYHTVLYCTSVEIRKCQYFYCYYNFYFYQRNNAIVHYITIIVNTCKIRHVNKLT